MPEGCVSVVVMIVPNTTFLHEGPRFVLLFIAIRKRFTRNFFVTLDNDLLSGFPMVEFDFRGKSRG